MTGCSQPLSHSFNYHTWHETTTTNPFCSVINEHIKTQGDFVLLEWSYANRCAISIWFISQALAPAWDRVLDQLFLDLPTQCRYMLKMIIAMHDISLVQQVHTYTQLGVQPLNRDRSQSLSPHLLHPTFISVLSPSWSISHRIHCLLLLCPQCPQVRCWASINVSSLRPGL